MYPASGIRRRYVRYTRTDARIAVVRRSVGIMVLGSV
jgi:hypothetical protein